MNSTHFQLFANCIPVKGASRSVICDVQRQDFEFIPNALYEILTLHNTKSIADIINHYGTDSAQVIEEYFEFLVAQEFGFYCDAEDLECFPALDLNWEVPNQVVNAIIDVDINSTHDYGAIIGQLEELNCNYLQIRVYSTDNTEWLVEQIGACLRESSIVSAELLTPYVKDLTLERIQALVQTYGTIARWVFHSSPKQHLVQSPKSPFGDLVFITQTIDSHAHCGAISPQDFATNLPTFAEAQIANSCLNKKISIATDGSIKNCPSLPESFGNVAQTSLQEALNHPQFKKYWGIGKDQIDTCKDCEFRYICTDCRAHLSGANSKYAKPAKCSYDPYTMEWG